MTDDADTIAKKIQKAKTDPEPLPSEEAGLANRPEAENLIGIYAALANTARAAVLKEFGGAQFSAFKKSLAEIAVSRIGPVNAEMTRLLADPAEIDRLLADGARRAKAIAGPIMNEVKDVVGFLRS
jgi:tryptophanyl-tRNA synthetase